MRQHGRASSHFLRRALSSWELVLNCLSKQSLPSRSSVRGSRSDILSRIIARRWAILLAGHTASAHLGTARSRASLLGWCVQRVHFKSLGPLLDLACPGSLRDVLEQRHEVGCGGSAEEWRLPPNSRSRSALLLNFIGQENDLDSVFGRSAYMQPILLSCNAY